MPGLSGTPDTVTFASLTSWVTAETIACSIDWSSSVIQVPGSQVKADRTCSLTPHRRANSTERIAGFAKIGPVDFPGDWGPDTIELHQLYLLGDWKGQGVSQALMDWVIATARAQGFERLVLSVYVDNIRAQRFYARYGMREIGRYEFRVGDQIDDDRIWALDL